MTAATKPGTAVATKPRDLIISTVEGYADQLLALAPEGVKPEHYVASLRLYMAQNPAVRACSPASVAAGIRDGRREWHCSARLPRLHPADTQGIVEEIVDSYRRAS